MLLLAAAIATLFEGGDASALRKVPPPGVRYRMNMAMATSAPWIDSNIWRYRRGPAQRYLCEVTDKNLPLAMAEAFATGVSLALAVAPEIKPAYERIAAFFQSIPPGPTKPWTNFTVSDDGSPQAGEAMNLMARRNLLYAVGKPGRGVVALSREAVRNPHEFVLDTRDRMGDETRLLRLFGSELTIAALAREGNQVRLHLVNYGSRPVESLRIRIQGRYAASNLRAYVYNDAQPRTSDWIEDGGYTEFSLERLPLYAILDLEAR